MKQSSFIIGLLVGTIQPVNIKYVESYDSQIQEATNDGGLAKSLSEERAPLDMSNEPLIIA